MDKYKSYSDLRKKLQDLGEVPSFMSTAGFQLVKDKKYIEGDETVKERFTTIANTLATHLPEQYQEHYRNRFFQLQWDGILGPSTPVYCNTGRPEKGLPISCSGSYAPDSVSGFYEVAHEIAMLSKNGFGTSVYLGDIRPRGSKITNGTIADGVVPVMRLIYNTANHISQGSTRRGSVACYLPISHPDFHEVCHWLENNADGSNFGWSWTHADIKALDDGDPEMMERYQITMYLRMLGIGYYINIDNINDLNPKVYKDNDIKVLASNLCLSEDTLVQLSYNDDGSDYWEESLLSLYDKVELGMYDIDKLRVKSYNQDTKEFHFTRFDAIIDKGEVDELYEIEYVPGKFIRCTADHQILTERGYVMAKDLTEDDNIIHE